MPLKQPESASAVRGEFFEGGTASAGWFQNLQVSVGIAILRFRNGDRTTTVGVQVIQRSGTKGVRA
jgi:hypothetical protein